MAVLFQKLCWPMTGICIHDPSCILFASLYIYLSFSLSLSRSYSLIPAVQLSLSLSLSIFLSFSLFLLSRYLSPSLSSPPLFLAPSLSLSLHYVQFNKLHWHGYSVENVAKLRIHMDEMHNKMNSLPLFLASSSSA